MTLHEDLLRGWARGMYPTEAGTELLLRGFDGKFARPGNAWVKEEDGGYWIDFESMPEQIGMLSGGEQRFLRIAASLGSSSAVVSLGDDISGLDAKNVRLVLAAIAHASGIEVKDHLTGRRYSKLYPWAEFWAVQVEVQPAPAPFGQLEAFQHFQTTLARTLEAVDVAVDVEAITDDWPVSKHNADAAREITTALMLAKEQGLI